MPAQGFRASKKSRKHFYTMKGTKFTHKQECNKMIQLDERGYVIMSIPRKSRFGSVNLPAKVQQSLAKDKIALEYFEGKNTSNKLNKRIKQRQQVRIARLTMQRRFT